MDPKISHPENDESKLNSENEKDTEAISNEISKRISSMTNNSSGTKFIGIRINFLILVIVIVFFFLLSYAFVNRGGQSSQKINLDQLVQGLKNNNYSQVLIQNNGKVAVLDKSFYTLTTPLAGEKVDSNLNINVSNSNNGDFNTLSVDDFIKQLSNQDLLSQFKTLFNVKQDSISEIVIGDNFVIGVKSIGFKSILIKNTTEQDFLSKLKNSGIDIYSYQIPIRQLRDFSKNIDQNAFQTLKTTGQIQNLYQVNGQYIIELKPDSVHQYYIDWSENIYSFTDALQRDGISLSPDNFQIISVNVPSGIAVGDVISLLTLVGFVILIFFIFRGAQNSGMGIMQFGQSKAKVFFGSKTDTTFADVAGVDEARDELNEIVDFLKNPTKYRKLGARIPKGILMVGPPGTGKTLLARAIAGEAKVPFFHTSGSEFEEMLVGAGASRVRDLFAKAKKASPALIFIDEIDAVARKRGTKIQSGNTEQTLNQILVEMDGFEKNVNLIVLAATNRPDVLDPAILRPGRFDRQVRIELPDMDGRKKILEIHGKNKPFDKNVNLESIAKKTIGFTGADLENILNEAAIIAANTNKKEITNNDIEEALSKVLLGPAKKSRKRTEAELKLVAYHEAGHAVVAKYTDFATPVDRISIVSRGSTGGVTMFLPEKDEYIMSRNKLIADIIVSLGGRAAEEVALDDITTGASNDIEKATQVAKRMVQRFGMSDKLGLVQYGELEDSEYLGYAYGESRTFSEKTAETIDEEVKNLIGLGYVKAKKILEEHRDKLDKVANSLLEKEVLSKEEFNSLF